MHQPNSPKTRLRAGVAVALAAALYCAASAALFAGAETSPQKDPKPDKKTESKAAKKSKKLSGSELYAIHCNRCHPERYPTERTPAQWKTIMLHMQVRANLPVAQAKAILKYLQEDAGTP